MRYRGAGSSEGGVYDLAEPAAGKRAAAAAAPGRQGGQ